MQIKNISIIILIPAFLISSLSGMAQSNGKNKMYRIWANQQMEPADWILYQVRDTSLVVSNSREEGDYFSGLTGIERNVLGIQELDNIYLRKNGQVGLGMFLGFIGGFLTGVTIGLIEGDSEPPAYSFFGINPKERTGLEKGLGYGAGLGLLGGVVGAIVGSFKIKIPINRSREQFELNKSKFMNYSYSKN